MCCMINFDFILTLFKYLNIRICYKIEYSNVIRIFKCLNTRIMLQKNMLPEKI